MDNSEPQDVVSQNAAAWNTLLQSSPAQNLPLALDNDDSLWYMPLDLLAERQSPTTESNLSLQNIPNVGWPSSHSSHGEQASWSPEMPMDVMPSASTFNQEPSLFGTETIFSRNQSTQLHILQHNSSSLHPNSRKRGPKAATMTDQRWKPAIDRIRHLWVVEKNSINKIRDTINKEFGFNATERQYKEKVKKMGLQRNCTMDERKKILRQVRHRKNKFGKESKYVRVRGHMISEEKIARWWKEQALTKSLTVAKSPSPLPSEISIQTAYHLNSVPYVQGALYENPLSETHNSIPSRLFYVAKQLNQVIDAQHARNVFNDIQQLLEAGNTIREDLQGHQWRLRMETNLVQIRNSMNLQSELMVRPESNVSSSSSTVDLRPKKFNQSARRNMVFATWCTEYGQLEISFWTTGIEPANKNMKITLNQSASISRARINLYTKSGEDTPICININFNKAESIPFNITYQAVIANNSEIWKIVEVGDVEALKKALAMRTARLTDRDEHGRSLLTYAINNVRFDMCKFLLEHGADPNSLELDFSGAIGPVHSHFGFNDSEVDNENLRNKTQCQKVFLSFDADPLIEIYDTDSWYSSYYVILIRDCSAIFESVLYLGKPFITVDTKVCRPGGSCELSPLILFAEHCRYEASDILEILEKAIFFIYLGADITCVDELGNNILHCILQAGANTDFELKETQAEALMMAICNCERCNAPFREPRQFLKAAISKGVKIYAINDYGETPTIIAEQYGRDKEWAYALEECGFNIDEVKLHTERWENVLDGMDDKSESFNPGAIAKAFEDFNSSFWNSGHIYQTSSLSFQEFYTQQKLKRRQNTVCEPFETWVKSRQMIKYLIAMAEVEDYSDSDSRLSDEQDERSSEASLDNVKDAPSNVDDELRIGLGELSGQNEPLNGLMQWQNHDGISPVIDNLAWHPRGDEAGPENNNEGNGSVDIADAYWDDPFRLGASNVGTPAMSFREFMNLEIPDICSDEPLQLGLPLVEDLMMNIDEL